MSNWIKWWKDKTFMTILAVALIAMAVTFLLAYFIEWGWIPAIAVALAGGFVMRKIVIKKLDDNSK